MSSKGVSSIKDRCTEEKKAICKKDGKLCNPNSTSQNPVLYCFNDTEKNREKIKDFNDKLAKSRSLQHSPTPKTSPNIPNTPKVPNIQKAPDVIKTKATKATKATITTILDFIKELGKRKYKTAKEVIDNIFNNDDGNEIAKEIDNNKSKQGFIYELLWDICIKFNITKFTNENTEHGGNINIKDKSDFTNIEDEIYLNNYLNKPYISGNSGGYSDITFRTREKKTDTQYDLNLISVKYIDNKNIKKYDIQNLCTLIRDRENELIDKPGYNYNKYKSIRVILFVKNKKKFKKIKYNKSSDILIKYISPNGKYENVYDLSDLEDYYLRLYKILEFYNFLNDEDNLKSFKDNYLKIKDKVLKPFMPRFHQQLFIDTICKNINNNTDSNEKKVLIGALPRSGKTYIMAGIILKDVIKHNNKKDNSYNNYIIITPAPKETLPQYEDAFNNHIDFKENNIVVRNINNKLSYNKQNNGNHNVYIVSKQTLGYNDEDDKKINEDDIRKKIKKFFGNNDIIFKCMFFDEAHFGMTTKIARNIFNELDIFKHSFKIYVTATYNKPKNEYDISKILNWGLEDIRFIKKYNSSDNADIIEYFSKRFDKDIVKNIINKYNNIERIKKDYNHFPEPFLITSVWDKQFLDKQKKLIDGTNFGFDMDKLFTYLADGITFENEWELKELFEYYLGYPIKKRKFNDRFFEFKEITKDNKSKLQAIEDTFKAILDKKSKYTITQSDKDFYEYLKTNCNNIYYEKDNTYYKPISKYKESDRDYNDIGFIKKRGIIPRIRDVCINECRTLQHIKHKTSQIWFLPGGTPGRLLDNVIFSLIYFLEKYFSKFFNSHKFFICREDKEIKQNSKNIGKYDDFKAKYEKNIIIQDSKTDDIKEQIKKEEDIIKKYDKYKGLIILTGNKLKLGVSLPNVDIVTLFTNSMSSDTIFQMLFRSMTEIENEYDCDKENYNYCSHKKYGFMVDLKPQRVLLTVNNIQNRLTDNQRDENNAEYIPIGDLINIDKDFIINKYDYYHKNKKETENEIKDYSIAYLNKLLDDQDYTNNKDIYNIITTYNFKIENISSDMKKYLKNYSLLPDAFKKNMNNNKELAGKKVKKKSKNRDTGSDTDTSDKSKQKSKSTSSDNTSDISENDNKIIISNLRKIAILTISLLSLLYDSECMFNKNERIIDIIELNKLLDNMKNDDNDDIKEVFINGFKSRINNDIPNKDDNQIFDFVKEVIKNMKKNEYSGGETYSIEKIRNGGDLNNLSNLLKAKRKQVYTIETPDKLLEQINETIPFTKKAKDERGEVFTPMEIVNEMLDTLPEEVWKNPNLKWLDPAAGMGNFPVAVYMRLIEGLKYVKGYEDEEKRRKHILENMLYMVEIDKTNVFMMRKIFCGKIYKLNIFEGSFIEDKVYTKEEIYNNNGFDIIVGNPPYNQGGVGKGGGVFWKYFVDKSFKILNNNGYILMIHPTGWRKPTSINASAGDIWKLFKNYNLMFLKISDKKIPGFPRVDYYVLNKNTKQQDTEVINIFELNQITKSSLNLYTLPFIPHLINKEVLSIINKILNKKGERFNIIYNQVIKPKKGDKITVGVPHAHYFDINNKNYQEKYSLYLTKPDYISHPKIIMTYNSGKKPAYLYAKYYSKELGTTNNTMYQIIKKADNKNNLVSFLNSRLIHFILKITQYSSPPNYKNEFNILNMFAKPNEDDITNDEDIYDYFKLTRKEINLIEENTKGFDKITGGLNKNKYKKYKLAKHYLNKKPKYNSI